MLKRLKNDNIVKFYGFFETDEHLIIIMELVCGGDLYKRLKKVKRYCEKEAALIMYNLLLSL